MLEDYFSKNTPVGVTQEQKQRLLAVQAALELAKASAGASAGQANDNKLKLDLRHATDGIEGLAKAIQKALEN